GTRRRRRRWRSASDDERTLARAAGRNAHRERIRARDRTGGWYSTERDHVIACADAWDREARAGPDRSGSIPVDGESIPAGPIDAARRRRDRDITGLGRRGPGRLDRERGALRHGCRAPERGGQRVCRAGVLDLQVSERRNARDGVSLVARQSTVDGVPVLAQRETHDAGEVRRLVVQRVEDGYHHRWRHDVPLADVLWLRGEGQLRGGAGHDRERVARDRRQPGGRGREGVTGIS